VIVVEHDRPRPAHSVEIVQKTPCEHRQWWQLEGSLQDTAYLFTPCFLSIVGDPQALSASDIVYEVQDISINDREKRSIQ
jgi:hypothetical protein